MRTEAQLYVEHLENLLERVERSIDELENKGSLSAQDEIELSALDTLFRDLSVLGNI